MRFKGKGEERFVLNSPVEVISTEIQVIPYGRHETRKGVFVLDEAGMEAIVAEFGARKNEMVIDYEHQTLTGGEAPAAGWVKRLFAVPPGGSRAPGLWAFVEWTTRAVEYLRNREYRYLSPVFLKTTGDNRVARLLNAALTNQPAIDGMVPVVNRAMPGGNPSAPPAGRKKNKEVRVMKRLLEALGLSADIAEDRAVEAVREMMETMERLSEALKVLRNALGLGEDAALGEIRGTVEAMKQGHELSGELGRKLAGVEARLRRKEAEELVAHAMKEGKVTPAQRDWAIEYAGHDPEGFSAFAAKAPVLVRMGEIAPEDGKLPGLGAIGEVQSSINSALGLDMETFARHNR